VESEASDDPVAVVDDDPNKRGSPAACVPVAGPVAELRPIVEKYQATRS